MTTKRTLILSEDGVVLTQIDLSVRRLIDSAWLLWSPRRADAVSFKSRPAAEAAFRLKVLAQRAARDRAS